MNILVISYIYPKKANLSQGLFVHQQAKYIAREGHKVSIITTYGVGDALSETRDNITVNRVASINHSGMVAGVLFLAGALYGIFSANKKENVNMIIGQFLGISTIFYALAAKVIGAKFIVVSHGTKWELPRKNVFQNLLIRFSLYFPSKIICVSNKTKEMISRNTDPEKAIVINNGMDPEYLIPSKSFKEFKKMLGIKNQKVILSVSNLVYKKGIDSIIYAIERVSKDFKNIIYLVVGDGYERESLEKLVKTLNLQKFVRFEGRKVGSDLANYYNICDLFVLMSKDIYGEIESFGIVYLEAAYFGKPVLGGKSGGTRDAILDGKTGYLANPEDAVEIAKKIKMFLSNEGLSKKMGPAGKKRVLKGFLWEHNAKKLLEAIK